MKKIILLIATTFMTLCLQTAMAETKTIATEIFSNEKDAIAAAQSLSSDLKQQTVSALTGKSAAQCHPTSDVAVKGFRIVPIWTENGSAFQKGYQAEVEVDLSCETKKRGPFWYASVKTI